MSSRHGPTCAPRGLVLIACLAGPLAACGDDLQATVRHAEQRPVEAVDCATAQMIASGRWSTFNHDVGRLKVDMRNLPAIRTRSP